MADDTATAPSDLFDDGLTLPGKIGLNDEQ